MHAHSYNVLPEEGNSLGSEMKKKLSGGRNRLNRNTHTHTHTHTH